MQPNGQRVSYATSAARGLAITQLVLGVLCLICGIAAVAIFMGFVPFLYTGYMEFWMPISFIVTGILGIVAASNCSNGIIVAHMVMSIISAVFAFSLFVDACIYARVFYTHIPLAILSFAELVIAIISAAFCCRAVCCRTSASGGVVVAGQPQGDTVVVTSGQRVVYAQQPVVYQQHYFAQPGVQYAPPGQYVVQPGTQQQMPPQYGVQQQMPSQQYGAQQQMPPQHYPQATGQATAPIETKPPEYAAQPMY